MVIEVHQTVAVEECLTLMTMMVTGCDVVDMSAGIVTYWWLNKQHENIRPTERRAIAFWGASIMHTGATTAHTAAALERRIYTTWNDSTEPLIGIFTKY